MMTLQKQLSYFPPAWAVEWGEDRAYGLYAVLEVRGVRQLMRWIQPGEFLMGSPESEKQRGSDETQHQVTLTKGYWLADSVCTQALWQAVTGENPSEFKDDLNNPVEQVSWDDVQEFLKKLNGLLAEQNLQARLPTEAEWEYACRAGTLGPFSFGDNISPEQVNYDGDNPYAGGAKGLWRQKTVAVKSLPANAWGLYEMHGNVWEWCADWYGEYDLTVTTDPPGAAEGVTRVVRGGSWLNSGSYCRSAYRLSWQPDYRNLNSGFRLALNE
ncbi:formylglycine-generating enzyme family protein [Methylomonas paludis]|uniref:Formylglycine-generating enzyme family protein n=1 Tax=Methylomonas paludis TaxID=1173101 RepID=A0A975MMJ6_9GAMM|nr:formylglycine-generating enzyme family protein [Methylomonas paludis]QWF70320.1 formylglycine-generating enzyme family protein [Methylomonas paludis]